MRGEVLCELVEIFDFKAEIAWTEVGVAIDGHDDEELRFVPAVVEDKACVTGRIFLVKSEVGHCIQAGVGVPENGIGLSFGRRRHVSVMAWLVVTFFPVAFWRSEVLPMKHPGQLGWGKRVRDRAEKKRSAAASTAEHGAGNVWRAGGFGGEEGDDHEDESAGRMSFHVGDFRIVGEGLEEVYIPPFAMRLQRMGHPSCTAGLGDGSRFRANAQSCDETA
jgi:hypothetical protein